MASILSSSGNHDVEADVIVTAMVVGFSASRIVQQQPFSFDIESPADWASMRSSKQEEFISEWQDFLNVLSALSEVLKVNGLDPSLLKDAQSPDWSPGALITGRAGGSTSSSRGMSVRSLEAQGTIELESSRPVGYCGRGAYTGTIDDPTYHHTFLQPTKRRVITDRKRWFGPGRAYWGLIEGHQLTNSPNLNSDPKIGMGPFRPDWNGTNGVVAYTHGMSWAMREAIRHGPWCTPYEIATGSQTTKMASCFACTTYMYAAGFPPSSIHLGRGESWCPLPEDDGDEVYQAIAKAMNTRWHSDCYNYLRLGQMMLQYSNKLNTNHTSANRLLAEKLQRVNPLEGGNLFLDALTVHQSDWKRIKTALKPVGKSSAPSYIA